eukprot:TRINITY_DN69165_c0_g1_i1.p1 TRINITY_DN69165_c0_g1~~TRINITY_DN69165_c0_g1_i1.p1  ORF type:complete len:384 (+),score=48.35 TRINITY_DN69165_c0_g1_i1:46-1197(+)
MSEPVCAAASRIASYAKTVTTTSQVARVALQVLAWGCVAFVLNGCTSLFVGGWAASWLRRRRATLLPSMVGKVVVVTGANGGIGFGTVQDLLRLGCRIVMCCRSLDRGNAARARLPPDANVEVMQLDLGSLQSINAFAEKIRTKFSRLDVLILNAGTASSFLGIGGFKKTSDGFEEMIGTNFLGHFKLVSLLLPILRATEGARVIACTSVAVANSYSEGIDPKTWTARSPKFSDWCQYGQSKLALLLFMRQLQQREKGLMCLACHPGVVAGTTLMHEEQRAPWMERIYSKYLFSCLAMGAEEGHLGLLFLAATKEQLQGGGLYFPIGRLVSWPWSRFAHMFQRVGALQAPVRMETDCKDLWSEAEKAINRAEGQLTEIRCREG